MSETKKNVILTPEFRGSFVHLMKPRAPRGSNQEPRYGINIVLPKDDDFWAKLDQLIDDAAREEWGKRPKRLKLTRKDGDESDFPEWAGCYTVPATCKDKPEVVKFGPDGELEEIIDRSEVYSGAYYRASIRVYTYDHPEGGKGVSIGLNNVLKIRDGDPLSGRTKAVSDFADLVGDGDKVTGSAGRANPLD